MEYRIIFTRLNHSNVVFYELFNRLFGILYLKKDALYLNTLNSQKRVNFVVAIVQSKACIFIAI